jgi:outer membrane protein assembly factor BamB
MIKFLIASLGLLVPAVLSAAPWAQYNGTNHDRIATEKVRSWASQPKEVWTVPAQYGFSSFVTGENAVFTLVGELGNEFCAAYDKKSGRQLWKTSLCKIEYNGGGGAGTKDNRGGDGPRSTPSYSEGKVYVYDASMKLHCLDARSGKSIWKKDMVEDYNGRNIRWQNSISPVIDGDSVYVIGGGAGESVLAFNKSSGKLLWKQHDTTMTHSTPVLAEIHGVRQLVLLTQDGVLSVDPKSGDKLWSGEHPYKTSSAASPIVYKDFVYVSSGYSVGASLFKVSKKGSGFSSEKLWYKKNELMNHWSTPLCLDGKLYGMFSFKKYGTGPLKCVDLVTGEELWSKDGFGPGNCILVGDRLIALSDAGELVQVAAKSNSYQELSRIKAIKGKCWSMPTFSDGKLYLRSTEEGACFILGK